MNRIDINKSYSLIEKAWIMILVTFILITTGGALNNIAPNISRNLNILMILLSIKPILITLSNKKDFLVILFIFIAWISINMIISFDTLMNSLFFIIKFITIFSIVKYCNYKNINLHKSIYIVVSFISLYSLIFYISIQIFKIDIPVKYIALKNYMTYRSYFGIFYWIQTININGLNIIRNSSIFWEPGMYQIFINYCILYVFFLKNTVTKIDKVNVVILTISMITTTSTTGMMLMIVLYILKLYSIKSKDKLLILVKIFTSVAVSIVGLYLIIYMLLGKSNTNSMNARLNDLTIPIRLFLQKPIFGWGFLNYDIYRELSGNMGNSNGVTTLIYQTGLMGVFMYNIFIIMLIRRLRLKAYNIYVIIALLIFILISNMAEPIIYSNFTILFLAMGYFGLCNKFENKTI